MEALKLSVLNLKSLCTGMPVRLPASELCLCMCVLVGTRSLGENPLFQLDFPGGHGPNLLRTLTLKIHFGGWRNDQAQRTGLLPDVSMAPQCQHFKNGTRVPQELCSHSPA